MTWAYGNSVDRWHGYCGYSSSENWQYYTINMSECGMESEANAFSIDSGGVHASASVTGQGSVSGSGSFSSAYNQSTYTSYCSSYSAGILLEISVRSANNSPLVSSGNSSIKCS